MGNWNTHGMSKDEEDQFDALNLLGMFPEELMALADHAEKEAWVWTELAKHEAGQKKRKSNLIAGFWRHRYRRWKELAAWAENEYDEEMATAKSLAGDPRGA